jgi:hypothetical protein
MFTFNIKDEILRSLVQNSLISGTGSHYVGDCPFCNKPKHFYLQRKTNRTTSHGKNASYYFHCKKCNENGGFIKFLKQINRLDIVNFGTSIDRNLKLENKIKISDDFSLVTEKQSLPLFYKIIYENK